MIDPYTGGHEYIPAALNMSHEVILTPRKNNGDESLDQIITKSTPMPEMNTRNALSEISFFYEDGLDDNDSEEAPVDKSDAQFILIQGAYCQGKMVH